MRGYTDLQLKDEGMVGSPSKVGDELGGHSSDYAEEKVICSLCWASTCGSILAVGYIDGDVLLWNISSSLSTKGPQVGVPSNNVVKLQLSSGERRLPVIVLHWSPISKSYNDRGGQLFIYGGDEIGSEEVLTVLTLEWSSGIETLRCIARVDLTLNGSFADMILINSERTEYNSTAALFVLTNPGQLNVYDGSRLSKVTSEEEKASIRAEQFPLTIPTVDPCMTVAKLILLSSDRNSSKALLEMSSAMKSVAAHTLSAGMKWPLTGGVPSPLSVADDIGVKRLYISGYQDGSVRVWDATYPVLSLVSVLGGEVPGINVAGISAPVSALDFCSITMSLAVGNECGLVCVYKLCESSNEKNCHFVTEAKHEVHITNHGKGFCCMAVISILNLPIRTFHFANSGAKLAVGFERGQVAMLDVGSFSIMFHTDCGSGSSSPVISVVAKELSHIDSLVNSPKHKEPKSPRDQEPKSPRDQEPKSPRDPAEGVLFILFRDACIVTIDSLTGKMTCSRPLHPKKESTAISMYVIDGSISVSGVTSEKKPQQFSQDHDIEKGSDQTKSPGGNKQQEVELHSSDGTTCSAEGLSNTLILLCCEDALRLYTLKSVMEGDGKAIRKVKFVKPCCWSTTFKTKNEKACGLALLYQTGVLEIRSLPDLEVVGESSLMSILRWSFKANMVKTMSSADSGQITLVNGCELAFISLLAVENDFRIPDSLPCLHDKVLAAAADAAINASLYQKKKQGSSPGILGGIIKGFKGEKAGHTTDLTGSLLKYSTIEDLESIFSRVPFSVPSMALTDDLGGVELDIDDIEIDEASPTAPASSSIGKHDRRDEETEREKLFHGTASDMKPRLRTAEEIRAQYRKAGDASSVAADARDKLVQRQEKLERISRRTAELESGAENFAAMANELVKTMEARKWWKL
ncbi:uncharacterized protein LOC131223597 isoform X2 [Magnolia sinica]|nr:uncharacterized protein LOC131223597 isoform X2 [Magnolia sinica]